jgi:hypothetical protein
MGFTERPYITTKMILQDLQFIWTNETLHLSAVQIYFLQYKNIISSAVS